jgi:hypothetical protein
MWRARLLRPNQRHCGVCRAPVLTTSFLVEFTQQFLTLRQICSTGHIHETSLRENSTVPG